MKRNSILLLLMVVLLSVRAGAQITTYSRTVLTGQAYNSISSGTVVSDADFTTTPGDDNDGAFTLTLPFTFTYAGTGYTTVTFCTNGWIAFNDQTSVIATNNGNVSSDLFTSSDPKLVLAPWFGDINANFDNSSPGIMQYGSIGTDVYAFEWFQASGDGANESSTNLVSFMVKLYGPGSSSPGRIEFCYGAASDPGNIVLGNGNGDWTIGIKDATGGSRHFINALDNSFTSTATVTAFPDSGTVYQFDPPPACTGTPTPGALTTTNAVVCSSDNFTLSMTNVIMEGDLTYQWEKNTGSGWSAISSNGTNETYTGTQSASAWYRLAVTCGNSSNTGYSDSIYVSHFSSCYCHPTTSNGCQYGDRLDEVKLNTLDNLSTCSDNNQSTDYGATAGITTLGLGRTYTMLTNVGDGGDEYVSAWIDFDHSGTFDASEYFFIGSGDDSAPISSDITIPTSATLGYTKMRVRVRWDNEPTDACSNRYGYGETEDYDVNIACLAPLADPLAANNYVCPGDAAVFTAKGIGAGITYKWQESQDGGATWHMLADAGDYSGTATNELTVANASTYATYQYRVIVYSSCNPDSTFSNASILSINATPVIGTDPVDAAVCATHDISFTAAATGGIITYQWQVSTDGGTTWTDLSDNARYSGTTSDQLDITGARNGMNGNQYRVVADNGCFSANSAVATLTVNPLPKITTDPSSTLICPNGNATFTAAASGVGLSYQWQVNDGNGWANLSNDPTYSNVTTTTLNITNAQYAIDGYSYRMVATSSVCAPTVRSAAATLSVGTNINITQQPVTSRICANTSTTFSTDAVSSNVTYQWQESTDNAATWHNVTNTGVYSGATTNTLAITSAPLSMNAYLYRCVISSDCNSGVYSDAAFLIVYDYPAITGNPSDVSLCDGQVTPSTAIFSISATGSNLTYQWEESTDNGSTWSALSNNSMYALVTTSNLRITNPIPSQDGNQYRCVVSGTCSPSVASTAATMHVTTRPAVTAQPTDQFICPGDNAVFTFTAVGNGAAYQWQINTGSGYTNLSNNTTYSGVTTNTLTVTAPTTSDNNTNYRCIVSGTCSPDVMTNAVRHFVSTAPTITGQPVDVNGCETGTATFYVNAGAITPLGYPNYQWEESVDNGVTWHTLSNGPNYTGTNASSLNVHNVTPTMDNNLYRCEVSTTCGSPVMSNPGKLTVIFLPRVGLQPANQTICPGTRINFAITGSGTHINYQWQVDDGSGYVDISSSDPAYIGNHSATLILPSPVTTMDNNKYRCVITGDCTPPAISRPALLKVHNPVTIVSQTIKDTVCENNDKRIGVYARGNSLIYQWQVQTSPGVYKDLLNIPPYSGANTDTLRISSAPASISDNLYRCMITENILCNLKFYSNDIPVHVDAAPITTPATTTVGFFSSVKFSVPNVGTSFQWQENANNTGFTDITDANRFDGINTNELTIKNVGFDMTGNQYRCVVDGICAASMASVPGTLIVDPSLSVNKVASASDLSMKVYPNPLSGTQLNISFNKALKGTTNVRVLDKLGNLVYQGTLTPGQANNASIELEAIAAGVYMLQVTNDNDHFNQTVSFTKQ
ncbi:MAG: T9SS type A sorting domain-containing protein [Bacteroidetes bacterium]|nr:T9SS type A sorting domain-containing protein [Bacteroidota bacterium]